MNPYIAVLSSAVLWSFAATMYAGSSARIGVRRLNYFKAVFSLAMFVVATAIWGSFVWPWECIKLLGASGALGYALGDLLLFYGYSKMGAGRGMMLAAFSPLFILVWSWIIYGAQIPLTSLWGISSMVACVIFLGLDKLTKFHPKPIHVLAVLAGLIFETPGIAVDLLCYSAF